MRCGAGSLPVLALIILGLATNRLVRPESLMPWLDSLSQCRHDGSASYRADMAGYRRWPDPLLRRRRQGRPTKSEQDNFTPAWPCCRWTPPRWTISTVGCSMPSRTKLPVIRDALAPHKDELVDKLWAVVEAPEKGKESQRLRAASALAKYDPESEKWVKVQEAVANDLVGVPAVYLVHVDGFAASGADKLLPHCRRFIEIPVAAMRERSLATDILADYAADQPQVLADLLMDADDKQFAVIYPKFKEQGEQGLPVLIGEIDKKLPPDLPSSDEKREKLAKRQANAAVALLQDEPAG